MFSTLEKEYEEALELNEIECEKLHERQADLKQLAERLESFNKSLEVDIMVPVGSKAIMPGKLYHTNEVFVGHGAGLFSKCSTHTAINICNVRSEATERKLELFHNERELIRNKLEIPHLEEAFMSDPSQEIIEEYDEERERVWREEHRRSVYEQKQQESQQRLEQPYDTPDDKNISDMLDRLELMEELQKEFENLDDSESNDDILDKMLSGEIIPSTTVHTNKNRKYHVTLVDEQNIGHQPIAINVTATSSPTTKFLTIDDEYCDMPDEFKKIASTTNGLSDAEKLSHFKTHAAEIDRRLKEMSSSSYSEMSRKVDMQYLHECLVDTVKALKKKLKTAKRTKKLKDDSLPTTEGQQVNQLPIDIESDMQLMNEMKSKVTETVNINVPNLVEAKSSKTSIRIPLPSPSSSSFSSESSLKSIDRKGKISFGDDQIVMFRSSDEPNQLSRDNSDVVSPSKFEAIPEELPGNTDPPPLIIKYKHSDEWFEPTECSKTDEVYVGCPADIYSLYANCMNMTADQQEEKEKLKDFVKKVASLDFSTLDMPSRQLNSPNLCTPSQTRSDPQLTPPSEPKKSILKNREAVHREIRGPLLSDDDEIPVRPESRTGQNHETIILKDVQETAAPAATTYTVVAGKSDIRTAKRKFTITVDPTSIKVDDKKGADDESGEKPISVFKARRQK